MALVVGVINEDHFHSLNLNSHTHHPGSIPHLQPIRLPDPPSTCYCRMYYRLRIARRFPGSAQSSAWMSASSYRDWSKACSWPFGA